MSIIAYKEQDGTINLHVSGYLTRNPKVLEKVVLFSVCYRKDKYMECKAWRDSIAGQNAACLETHDNVTVDGIFETFTKKDGTTAQQLSADCVTPVIPLQFSDKEQTEAQPSAGNYEQIMGDQDEGLPF